MWTGKLLRLARIKRLMDKYAEDLEDVYQALAVVKVVVLLLSLAHYSACAWHYIGWPGDRPEDYEQDTSWYHGVLHYNDTLGTRYSTR